jgi:predicted glycoside hydrolase/deacetylase ChbG (UPF0249 family)
MHPPNETLIINADDFGLSHSVNMAVIQSFKRGLCTSCSIMPNMPGFEEACELANTHGLNEKVGLHLTLTDGRPLTEDMKNCPRFCDAEGRFRPWRKGRALWLNRRQRTILEAEITAQITLCGERGLSIAHLDTHGQIHEERELATSMMRVAVKQGIRRIRICRNFGPGLSRFKAIYRHTVNSRLRRAQLSHTDYFGTAVDYLVYCYRKRFGRLNSTPGSWEVMIHPDLDDRQQLVDSFLWPNAQALVRGMPLHETAGPCPSGQ